MASSKKQRTKLWLINPHCENCGILTILPEHLPIENFKNKDRSKLKTVPDNMATIQHKYDRNHPLRNKKISANDSRRHFLWCYKCNHDYYKQHEEIRSKIISNENKL